MYESYSCTGSSYHDFLSRSGSRGFYLDPVEDYRADHFHSRESFPCRIARSLYVWCSRFFLRAYQEFLIAFVFSLLISCPAFAEDENYQFQYIGYEAMANQGMDVNQYLMDQYQEERNSEIAQILAEPLANPSLRSVSVDSDLVDLSISRVDDDRFYFVSSYLGDYPISDFIRFSINTYDSNDQFIDFISYNTIYSDPITGYFNLANNVHYIRGYYLFNVNNQISYIHSDDVSSNTLNSEPIITDSFGFFDNVREVFTWILDHIAEIITFILGNAFLSVSLLLFMCGAVISFYVRIRRS